MEVDYMSFLLILMIACDLMLWIFFLALWRLTRPISYYSHSPDP